MILATKQDEMEKARAITCLFLDIGGVMLTNGWDHHERRRAAKHFKLGWAEMEERHALNFETHEEGRMTFNEYLSRVHRASINMVRTCRKSLTGSGIPAGTKTANCASRKCACWRRGCSPAADAKTANKPN